MLAFREPAEKYFEIARSLDIFTTLFKEVNATYVDEVDPQQLIRTGIDEMLESLDPYTDYIPENELESFRITTTGQYAGIGALIGIINNRTIITEPYEGFPAGRAGIRVGDEIISVDRVPVAGKSTAAVSSMLKGQPKTEVEVKIRRVGNKEDLVFKLQRERISIRNLPYHGIIDKDIAYLKLDDFTPGAGKEISQALTELIPKGATRVILDLRDNPGGMLHEAVNVASIFIPKGSEVVSTRGKVAEWNKTYTTLNHPSVPDLPLIVLTNGGSASASEIVAGSLQDYDRAVLVGERTFGKGLVQTTRPLSYNAQLKVTTAKYYIPSGRCIQALDYSQRNEDGTVSRHADSTRNEFKTRNGRKVFDGGGLDPDVPVAEPYLGTITLALLEGSFFFEFATNYCSTHQPPNDFRVFSLSDQEYNAFVEWVLSKKFSYVTPLEKSMNDLIESAKTEKSYDELKKPLDGLNDLVKDNKRADFERFRPEIKTMLERQIAYHFALHRGFTTYSAHRDETVKRAVQLLNDRASYDSILSRQ
jgi:carboxyl-terminal processing protease